MAIANWIAALFSGDPSPMLHRFLSAYVRYVTHVVAYLSLAANPYPGFAGRPGYPVDVEIDPPARQNRWVTGFRLLLAIPAVVLADSLVGFGTSAAVGSNVTSGGVLGTVALLGWFASLARGRMPQGMRDLAAYAIGYSAQVNGFVLLLTDRYPEQRPGERRSANVYRDDPIRVPVDDDLRRSRLTVFFRLLLAPRTSCGSCSGRSWHCSPGSPNWFATLISGRSPAALHRFLSAYLRYQVHLYAFLQLVANPFPGFAGKPGTYPVDVEIDPLAAPEPLGDGVPGAARRPRIPDRERVDHRAFLAAVLSWFYALVRGRVPKGLRNLGGMELRYYAQTAGYCVSAHRPLSVQRSVVGVAAAAEPGSAAGSSRIRASGLTV